MLLSGVGGGEGYIGKIAFGEGWEVTVYMPSYVTYVTKEHFIFIKRTLTYLALSIIQGRK